MSTGPTTPQQDGGTDVGASPAVPREPVHFPRLQLPTVPAFARPMVPADELPVQRPLVDAPTGAWQSPFPTPEPTNDYTFMVVPPPPPPHEHYPTAKLAPRHDMPRSAHATYCALPTAAPAAPTAPTMSASTGAAPIAQPAPATPARTSVPAMVPHSADTTSDVDDPAVDAPTTVSTVALALLVVGAALLVWASRMAFSPALLAMSALMLAETAIALSLTGAKRPTSAVVAAGVAVVIGLLALKGALGNYADDMAFVASLFVLVAALPTLILLGALEFVIRKRSSASPANAALRAGSRERFGAAVVLLVSGFLARESFSARPDAFATFCIVLAVALGVSQVLRGTGRAARA